VAETGAALALFWRGRPAATGCATVERVEAEELLLERGQLEACNLTPVAMGADGEIVVMTASGEAVQAGDIVLRTDESPSLDRFAELEVNLQASEDDLAVCLRRRELAAAECDNNLLITSNRLALAEIERERLERGLSAGERRLLAIQGELRRLDLEEAEENLRRLAGLAGEGFAASATVESARRRVATARAAVEEAEVERRMKTAPPRPEERLERERTVDRLRGELSRALRARQRRLDKADADIAVARAHLVQGRADLDAVRDSLAGCVVRAPTSGVFRARLFQDWRSGGLWQPFKPGVSRGRGDRVADIVQPGEMQVLLAIHEADADRVRTGMPVRVRVPALGNRLFEGVLAALGGVGRDRCDVAPRGFEESPSGVAMYNAVASLRDGDAALRPGMSAATAIVLAPRAPRLLLPRTAAADAGGGRLRVVVPGRPPRPLEVRGRYFGPRHVLIESGLKAGDRVLDPLPAASGVEGGVP
jgi:multidrug resistance efflux pump